MAAGQSDKTRLTRARVGLICSSFVAAPKSKGIITDSKIPFYHQPQVLEGFDLKIVIESHTLVIGYYDYHLMTLSFACFISFQCEKRVLGCERCFVYENARFPFVVSPVYPLSHRQFTLCRIASLTKNSLIA